MMRLAGMLFSLIFIGLAIVLFNQEPTFLEVLVTFTVIDLYTRDNDAPLQ